MNKFFIMTRGRTGSTAVIDSLNNTSSICAAQELFIRYDFTKKQQLLSQLYTLVPPFDIWKERGVWWSCLYRKLLTQKALIRSYLRDAEKSAKDAEKVIFGFKVLSHHFDETHDLKEVLFGQGYHAIYLTRNIPRQVISGMVAKLRGKYNAHASENYVDDSGYTIDIKEFEALVKWETQAVANDLAMLESMGGSFIEVRYEDFIADRQSFFDKIFNFLGVESGVSPLSRYSVMIKDLRGTVNNYDMVADCAARLGVPLDQ